MQTYRCLLILVAMLVGACQSQHPLAQRSTQWMGDFSPVGSYEVQRRHSFILPYDASIYIANPVNAIVTDDGVDVNSMLVSKMKGGLSQHFAKVFVGLGKERFNQALNSSREMGAQFMVYGNIERWPNITPIKLESCKDNDPDCRKVTSSEEQSGEARIAVTIYETMSGKLVDLMTIRSQRGLASYLYEDHQQPLDDVVALMIKSLSEKR
ncbi:MAG: DUF4823 domain-containing protein [Pseudomonadales bacterium]|nr:DUF4823 domain-containing protein [Pseudomonadales bacterium]